MKFKNILLFFMVMFVSTLLIPEDLKNSSEVDFSMVESAIDLATLIGSGSGKREIEEFLNKKMFNTKGFGIVSDYLKTFEGWNRQTSLIYLHSLFDRRVLFDGNVKNHTTKKWEDRSKRLWKNFIKRYEFYKKQLGILKGIRLKPRVVEIAEKYLPGKIDFNFSIGFIIFGHSMAFSIKNYVAFDLLQLPFNKKRELIKGEIIEVLAHEVHHLGFNYFSNIGMKKVSNRELISLVGLLASEGIPTYYIDRPYLNLDLLKKRKDLLYKRIYLDWISNKNRLNQLYREAETDIGLGLKGSLSLKAILLKWDLGVKGAVYILGSDMISIIDRYLGREPVLEIVGDYRKLLFFYNKAAKLGGKFLFNSKLVKDLLCFSGDIIK